METRQDDPSSPNDSTPAQVFPREPEEADEAMAWPAGEDDPGQTIEEPGYGHGV